MFINRLQSGISSYFSYFLNFFSIMLTQSSRNQIINTLSRNTLYRIYKINIRRQKDVFDTTRRHVLYHYTTTGKNVYLNTLKKKNTNSIYFVDIELSIRKYTLMFLEFLPNSPRFRLCFERYS